MSSESTGSSSGRLFAADLKATREENEITIEQMHARVRAPINVLEEFEETALLDNDMFNKVYLRSFVRSYAAAIDFDEARALAALEAALSGEYRGELRLPPGTEPVAPVAETPEAGLEDKTTAPGKPPEEKDVGVDPIPTPVPAKLREEAGQSFQFAPLPRPKKPARLSRRSRFAPRTMPMIRWPYVLLGGAVILVIVIFIFQRFSGRQPVEVVAKPDSTLIQAKPLPPEPQPIVLPDTLSVFVVAVGRIDPIYVRVDKDIRRPYWIEKGDSLLFRPTERILIQSRRTLKLARITLEGYDYPKTPADTLVVITRETAREILQSISDREQRP